MIIAKKDLDCYLCPRCNKEFSESQRGALYNQYASYCSESCFFYARFGMDSQAIKELISQNYHSNLVKENWDKDKR